MDKRRFFPPRVETHGYLPSWFFLFLGVLVFFFFGCAAPVKKPPTKPGHPAPYKIGRAWYQPMKHARGFRQRGIASWYGKDFHGRKTANGETYNMYGISAAHKTLPLGTYVKVYNLRNDKTIVVRINDRGPFVRGRIIDLSYGAAKEMGLVGPGTAPVKIVALGTPQKAPDKKKGETIYVPGNYYVGDFSVQVGAFRQKENALTLKDKLAKAYDNVHIVVYESNQGTFYRVRVAKCTTLDEARQYEQKLEADGFPQAIVVAR
jgi:rare lipoprotein A